MANYTYTPNVPQSTQKISATQAPIQNNFSAINEFINDNHFGFTSPTNYGMHAYTSLVLQPSDPTTSSGEMAVYSKATPSGANAAEIFYRYPSNGTVVQLTGSSGGSSVNATPGVAYLSSTLFMMWGTAAVSSSASTTITFPTGAGFPVFSSAPYQIYFTAATNYTNYTAGSYIASSTTTNFVFTVPGANYATSIF